MKLERLWIGKGYSERVKVILWYAELGIVW